MGLQVLGWEGRYAAGDLGPAEDRGQTAGAGRSMSG